MRPTKKRRVLTQRQETERYNRISRELARTAEVARLRELLGETRGYVEDQLGSGAAHDDLLTRIDAALAFTG